VKLKPCFISILLKRFVSHAV